MLTKVITTFEREIISSTYATWLQHPHFCHSLNRNIPLGLFQLMANYNGGPNFILWKQLFKINQQNANTSN